MIEEENSKGSSMIEEINSNKDIHRCYIKATLRQLHAQKKSETVKHTSMMDQGNNKTYIHDQRIKQQNTLLIFISVILLKTCKKKFNFIFALFFFPKAAN